jgi:hypothetical protein
MSGPKRFDYFSDEIDWARGRGYRLQIPYNDHSGQRCICRKTSSARKLGLSMLATERLAKAECNRLMQLLGAASPKKKKARPRKRKKRVGIYKFNLLVGRKKYAYWAAYWRTKWQNRAKVFLDCDLGLSQPSPDKRRLKPGGRPNVNSRTWRSFGRVRTEQPIKLSSTPCQVTLPTKSTRRPAKPSSPTR